MTEPIKKISNRESLGDSEFRWPAGTHLYAFDRDQPVTFHLRRQCEREAMDYDRACMAQGQPSQLGQVAQ